MKLTVAAPVTGLNPSPITETTSPTAARVVERPVILCSMVPRFPIGSESPPMKALTERVRSLTSSAVRPASAPVKVLTPPA
ncbi:hypothetical protein D3C86_2011640 [compost metagenome]